MSAIACILHVNINCRDFARSLAFYESIGFRIVTDFPEAEYSDVGPGLGVGRHRMKGVLMAIGADDNPTYLDLLEWLEPRQTDVQPRQATDFGIQRIAFLTNDLDADIRRLRNLGTAALAEPILVEASPGNKARFVCFRDPDGNLLELVGT